MRRIEQVRIASWVVNAVVITQFFAFLIAPAKYLFPSVLACFGVIGIWGIVYPEGVLGWAKRAHPELDVDDTSIWWVPRLIGAIFLLLIPLVAFASHGT